jgi:NADH-quinone oxidoreductase subunit E
MKQVDRVIASYNNDKNALIQILLQIQKENRWLPEEALRRVSKKLDVPINQIYHIATFYKAFSLVPHGRHSLAVCLGTACHVRGAPRLLDKVSEVLGIKPGETSKDMKYSLNTVNCLGCCALGPVLQVDDEYYSYPSSTELKKIIAECD